MNTYIVTDSQLSDVVTARTATKAAIGFEYGARVQRVSTMDATIHATHGGVSTCWACTR